MRELCRIITFGAARYRLAEPPVENAGEKIGTVLAQRFLYGKFFRECVQRQLRQQIE